MDAEMRKALKDAQIELWLDYCHFKERAQYLAEENARLRTQIDELMLELYPEDQKPAFLKEQVE